MIIFNGFHLLLVISAFAIGAYFGSNYEKE